MTDIFDPIIEFWGRNQPTKPVNFSEDEIIKDGPPLSVWFITEKAYINLPPTVYGVLIAPDGQRTILHTGGLWELRQGKYRLQYIDQRERTRLLDMIEGTTSDGFQVNLRVQFSYRVIAPERILDVEDPVGALRTTLETAIKNYIISHTHDEIIKPAETDDSLNERALERYVVRLVVQNPSCRGFTITNLFVQEWVGDPKYLELRKAGQFLERESLNKQKQLHLQQNVLQEEKELERKKGEVQQTKAEAELTQQQILAKVQQLKIELEQARTLPERNLKEILNLIEAIKQYPGGFPRKAVEELTEALVQKARAGVQPEPESSNGRSRHTGGPDDKLSDLTRTILDLVRPRNP